MAPNAGVQRGAGRTLSAAEVPEGQTPISANPWTPTRPGQHFSLRSTRERVDADMDELDWLDHLMRIPGRLVGLPPAPPLHVMGRRRMLRELSTWTYPEPYYRALDGPVNLVLARRARMAGSGTRTGRQCRPGQESERKRPGAEPPTRPRLSLVAPARRALEARP